MWDIMNVVRTCGVILLVLNVSWAAPKLFDLDMFANPPEDLCLNDTRAVKCVPDFQNVAFGREVEASSTCGAHPTRHCRPRQNMNELQNCFICDSRRQYPTVHLTDLNNQNNETCWVSNIAKDADSNVTLTLSLGKKFEVTYVSLQFCSRIADSMVIYKSKDYGKSWIPFQYYSGECQKVYGKDPTAVITKANEQEAMCSQNHSKGGTRIAFSTLTDRPSSYHFEESPVLQDWVTATDIKIIFNRLSSPKPPPSTQMAFKVADATSGVNAEDEMFYGVSDLSVGGRCKCNGHASKCIPDSEGRLACDCRHNTEGRDCEKCKPFHLDRPWARATDKDAHECVGKFTYKSKIQCSTT